jgi:hypothetical protein
MKPCGYSASFKRPLAPVIGRDRYVFWMIPPLPVSSAAFAVVEQETGKVDWVEEQSQPLDEYSAEGQLGEVSHGEK